MLFLLYLKVFVTPSVTQQPVSLTPTPMVNPPQTLLQTIPPITPVEYLSDEAAYKFSGKLPSLPEKANLLYYDDTPTSSDELTKLAQTFGFSAKPESLPDTRLGTMYLWNTESRSFTAGGAPLEISYSQTTSSLAPIGFAQTEKELVGLAKNKLTQYGLPVGGVDFDSPSSVYFKQDEEKLVLVESKTGASFVQIKLTRNYQGLPAVTNPPDITDIALTLDSTGNLIRLSYLYPFKINQQKEVSLIPASKAVSQIKQKGLVMKLVDPLAPSADDLNQDNYRVSSVDLSSLSLNYFYLRAVNNANRVLYPVYVLTGEAVAVGGKKLSVVVYLPSYQD